MIGSILLVALYRVLPPPATPLMLLRLVEGYGIDKSWRPLDRHLPASVRAAMAGEDARFCRHRGFDWGAIETPGITIGRAAACSAPARSRCRPPRTSSCGPAATGCAKASKPDFTALIELAWGKQRIMEIYLNVVEWGPGIYGAEAAARHYFHNGADA